MKFLKLKLLLLRYLSQLVLRGAFITACFDSQLMRSVPQDHTRFSHQLLLLCGDIEVNPGPDCDNYSIGHPFLCGFYRSAIYDVFTGKDLNGGSIQRSVEDGFNDAKVLFGDKFNFCDIDVARLTKKQDGLFKTFKKWRQNHQSGDAKAYLETFSFKNWQDLSVELKSKHSLECLECKTSYLDVHAKYPVNPRYFSAAKKELDYLVTVKATSIETVCDELAPKIENIVSDTLSKIQVDGSKINKDILRQVTSTITDSCNKSYEDRGRGTFGESFRKLNNLQVKPSPKVKYKVKQDTIKTAFNEIEK